MNKIMQIAVPLMSFSSGAFVLAASANDHLVEPAAVSNSERNILDTPLCFDIQDKSSPESEHTVTPDLHKPIEFGAFIGAMAH